MAVAVRRGPPDPDLGRRFADAELIRHGERFDVFRAVDTTTGDTVFVKAVARTASQWVVDVLGEQADVLDSLRGNPHVIALLDRVNLPGRRPALVLEHCPVLLSDALRDGRRTPAPEVAALGMVLAGALGAVHRAGVLHCDVCPATVLRRDAGDPVLAAFDNAVRIGAADRPVLARPGAHTAPELLLGESPTERTDVYGLAATLYELLAGRSAFRAYADEAASATAARVLDGRVPTIVAADVPLALSDLLTWSLTSDPADRPPSPAWIVEELRRIQTEQGWQRTPVDD